MNAYEYLLEPLIDDPSYIAKKSFGGLFIYYQGKLVIVLMDDPSKEYRGKTYPFAPWDGVLIPTDKSLHKELIEQFSFLKVQPFLTKWLMIPNNEDLENQTEIIMNLILSNDERIGVWPKPRRKKISQTGGSVDSKKIPRPKKRRR